MTATDGTDAEMTTPTPAPPDPKREALRKYSGLLLQHKVGRDVARDR